MIKTDPTRAPFTETIHYALLYLPTSGLFYNRHSGQFHDGSGREVAASTLYLFSSKPLAEYAATVYRKRPMYKHGSLAVIPVVAREQKKVTE